MMNTILVATLVIYTLWGGYGPQIQEHHFPSMDECLKVLAVTKIAVSQGAAENEWLVIATCKYRQ